MGDTGSMSLGITLGVIAMLTNNALLLIPIGFVFMVESLSKLSKFYPKIFKKKFSVQRQFIITFKQLLVGIEDCDALLKSRAFLPLLV